MGIKMLHLTGITSMPNEKGEAKIAKANGKKTDNEDGGMPLSFYRENNLRPPADAEEDEIERDDYGSVLLNPEDVDEVGIAVSIPLKNYAGAEASTDGTSIVYTSYGYQFSVFESIEEIDNYVDFLSSPWHVRKWAEIKIDWHYLKIRLGIIKIPAKRIETEE